MKHEWKRQDRVVVVQRRRQGDYDAIMTSGQGALLAVLPRNVVEPCGPMGLPNGRLREEQGLRPVRPLDSDRRTFDCIATRRISAATCLRVRRAVNRGLAGPPKLHDRSLSRDVLSEKAWENRDHRSVLQRDRNRHAKRIRHSFGRDGAQGHQAVVPSC